MLDAPHDEANIAAVRAKVATLTRDFSRLRMATACREASRAPARLTPMRCPFCSHEDTTVVETRDSDEGDVVRRRRRCQSCDKRFTTYEHAEIALPQVVKKDGTRADFDPAKVRASMTLALRKRPVSVEQIDAAMVRIQDKLLNSGAREVLSSKVGEHVMRELKRIDKVAYVRFASVYRSFEDVDEFRQLIQDI